MTDGEDNLQFLADGELEGESDDDAFSWGEDISSDKEEESMATEEGGFRVLMRGIEEANCSDEIK